MPENTRLTRMLEPWRGAPESDVVPTDVDVHHRRKGAAGLEAVAVSMNRGIAQMGPARTLNTLRRLNQADGFDCMGCAWPDPDPEHRSFAEFCENGAKAVAEEATKRRADPGFFARHAVSELATWSDFQLGQQGRITEPMLLREGGTHYEPVTWGEAFGIVAEEMQALASPDEAVLYTSGRASNEAAFVFQLFARAFGTNNLPDCSNMCHESTSVALAETIGIGKGSVSLEDVHEAELVIIAGQNPGTNHPRMLSALEKCVKGGGKIVAVNPLPETGLMKFDNPQTLKGLTGVGTDLADEFLPIRLGGDLALFQALGALLVERGAVDQDFVDRYTTGFETYKRHVQDLDWDLVLRATGLERSQIERVADLLAGSSKTVFCWAMGVTQQKHAVSTIKEITNVALLQGNIGKPGAGLCPVRGHSNVQGDRTMGIWEKLPAHFAEQLRLEFGFTPPKERGHDVVNSIRALQENRVKVLIGLGGNLAAATPDSELVHEVIRSVSLGVQVSTKLNRTHVLPGRRMLILPCLGRTEKDITAEGWQGLTVEDSMSQVHLSVGRNQPAGPMLRGEPWIVCRMAEAVLGDGPEGSSIDWAVMAEDYTRIRHHIGHVVPGCDAYDEKVQRPGGFTLPHPPRDSRVFETASGKAEISSVPIELLEAPEGHLVLQTLRSHDQFNTTIYGHDDRYRGLAGGRNVVMVHPDDITALGLRENELYDVVSEWVDGSERVAHGFRVVSYPTARGCAAAYYPECNVLVPLDHVADASNCPVSKGVVVRFEPLGSCGRIDCDPESRVRSGSDQGNRSDVEPHHLS
ncbi:FdhF/YdeP family oxidoreductase [Arthrobacter sp. NEB 688]|uniref:FdhF/YdeP family oxidoreductase n=1 Tax=Arthrobacter sp. NEB 688 TaxID=904039 RepID=UPI001565ACE6|nr:FdhF/YdeP family oxidoreductase [Arthrobacter sp. NEB 688]QKE83306.1 FdhF/YdeP family oxidoreductase [Arthrobacter sp. NEB 688]